MGNANIATGFSSNPAGEEAIKEASSQIKSTLFLPRVKLCFVFFTPGYNPWRIKETLEITLRPEHTFGFQAPYLIYEDKIVDKGVIVGAFALEKLWVADIFLENSNDAMVESTFRKTFMKLKMRKECVIASFAPAIEINQYLKGIRRATGSALKIFGAGFLKKYGVKNFQITSQKVDEGAINIVLGGGISASFERIGGFIPVGKTFKITKASSERNLILEIDNKPATWVYKKYLENQFDIFRRASFGKIYPIGIKEGGDYRIVSVVEFLEGDALLCLGKVTEGMEGKIMVATPSSLLSYTRDHLLRTQHMYRNVDAVIVFSSLTRKKILLKDAGEEISLIKEFLGKETKVIGIYSDYQVVPDTNIGEFVAEDGRLNLIILTYGNH